MISCVQADWVHEDVAPRVASGERRAVGPDVGTGAVVCVKPEGVRTRLASTPIGFRELAGTWKVYVEGYGPC